MSSHTRRRVAFLPKLLAQLEGGSIRAEAIDPLLSLVVGGKFDIQKKYIVRDAGGLLVVIDAVDHCSSEVQVTRSKLISGLIFAI
jgi:hypothetical protein